ncbi:MAG: sugar phosphate isomerase/epimerase [Verrucomicrobia bacterium]|nr:sugar phosphate isomerase/epimerase [Verrucomicrobiota bacterium]
MTFPASTIIISDEVSQDLPVLRDFIREFKLPGIELRSLNGRAFKDLTKADLAEVSAASRAEGWKVFGCATPVFKCDLDDTAAIALHRDIFKRSLDTARALNADLLRVFTFLRTPNPAEPAKQARVVEHLRGLVELAAGSGIRLGVENEHSCLAATADETLAILAPLPADRVGAIWDPCNVLYVPGAAAPTPADLVRLAPRLFHLHVKDAIRRTGSKPGDLLAVGTPVGLGEVGWREHLRALGTTGYRGLLSLETHWRLEKIDESLLHLPAGHAFSHGGEAASRTCLHNLKAILETL